MNKFIKTFIIVLILTFSITVTAFATEFETTNTKSISQFELNSSYEKVDLFLEDKSQSNAISKYSILSQETIFPDVNINVTLKALTKSDTDFIDILDTTDLRIPGDVTNYYFGLQGGCYDGQYYYYSFIVKNASGTQVDTRIACVEKNTDGSFSVVALNSGLIDPLQHANDMTYNENTDEIVIACCSEYEQRICTISAEQLQNESAPKNFIEYDISCVISSIDYNKTRNQYVVSTKEAKNYLVVLDGNFNLIKGIGDKTTYTSDENWNRQGISCDNKYIYYSYFLSSGNTTTYTLQNKIRIFDWSGNYIKTLLIDVVEGTDRIYEIENIIFTDDKVLLGFNCPVTSQNRRFCYADITDLTYHIEYCPDENINEYIGVENDNVSSIMFRGIPTELYKFRVKQPGKNFVGWTLYRSEVDKWYYETPSGTKSWYKEGSQPTGSTKVIYEDKKAVTQTGASGEHLLMCAQWETTNKFNVTFVSNGGTGTMSNLEVVYGTGANLTTNAFSKTNRTFKGWNAYWSELNKWYYTDSNGNRGWYTEGFEPDGYKKYVYSDGQNVVQTVYAGSNVYMYAAWDEYKVYCNANGAKIGISGIKPMITARNSTGYTNYIETFTSDDLYLEERTFNGCYLYREEIDSWYYESSDGAQRKWCKEGSQPAGYKKYLKTFNSDGVASFGGTALAGETLVLVAQWS